MPRSFGLAHPDAFRTGVGCAPFARYGLLAARVACCFDDAPWVGNFVRAVYRANFVVDTDIADPVVISSCIAGAGEDPDAVLERAQAPESKEKLREQTDEAMRIGIFGAPTVVTPDGELFWGDDRLEQAIDWTIALRHRRA